MSRQAADYDDYSDTVLYDVFYESGTQLGGRLVALMDQAEAAGNHDARTRYQLRKLEIGAERAEVLPTDRAAQVAAILRWQRERQNLAPMWRRDEGPRP